MVPFHAALSLPTIDATLGRTRRPVAAHGRTFAARVLEPDRILDARRVTAAEARAVLDERNFIEPGIY